MLDKNEGLRLIVGLGNPGMKYATTRHNIGFRVLDRLASDFAIEINREKFSTAFGRGRIEGLDVVLSKPLAFMNRSGPPARSLADFFRISSREMVVVHDDIDLAYGRLKIKEKGGHGGHNGVRSLIDAFGGGDFTRLRVGIGRSETATLPGIIERARDAVVTILCKGTKIGMNQFNTKPVTRTD
jgi:peptidyl-tRNA hydrolase, PTH1 family